MFISSILATSFYILVQQYSLPNLTLQNEYRKTGVFEYNQIYDMYHQRFNFDDLVDIDDYFYDIELHYVDNEGDYLVARGGIENVDGDTPLELPFSYVNNFQSNLKFVLSITDVENDGVITSHTFDTLMGVTDEYEYELNVGQYNYVDFEMDIAYSLYPQYVYDGVNDGSFADGYTSGSNDGYNAGYDSGYQDGLQTGNADGYTNGYNVGHTVGYSEGYNTALQGHSFSFTNLFASISDTPILMIRRMFSFDIFGVSAISILLTLFTALIFIRIIKRVV